MRIRTGRSTPDPQQEGSGEQGAAAERRIRPGGTDAPTDGPKIRTVKLSYPQLTSAQVGDTMMLFQEFLEHLDRLGLCEAATHVSLGFERFRAMYEPPQGA
jgi:hypothetical protein